MVTINYIVHKLILRYSLKALNATKLNIQFFRDDMVNFIRRKKLLQNPLDIIEYVFNIKSISFFEVEYNYLYSVLKIQLGYLSKNIYQILIWYKSYNLFFRIILVISLIKFNLLLSSFIQQANFRSNNKKRKPSMNTYS